MFELTNEERKYFGLKPVPKSWQKVNFKGDALRPNSILYYDGDVIKRQIISTDSDYEEKQYEEFTKNQNILLPKTNRGKERKLTSALLEKCTPIDTYVKIKNDKTIIIGNHSTQRTFYSSEFDKSLNGGGIESVKQIVNNYIETCPNNYFDEIDNFNSEKRKNNKYKEGDFFRFKINRSLYGFGRILLNISKIRKKNIIDKNHGLYELMGPPVLIKLYAILSENKNLALEHIKNQTSLPSSYIMDNHIFYGDYEIIGNLKLKKNEIDFPISYGRRIDQNHNIVYLQWGLIHLELPLSKFSKYLNDNKTVLGSNPYKNSAIGFSPTYGINDLRSAVEGKNVYKTSSHWLTKLDLRNPINEHIKNEIMIEFGLNPVFDYLENAKIAKATDVFEFI